MIELTLIFSPSYVCHDMNIFWPTSFLGATEQNLVNLGKT